MNLDIRDIFSRLKILVIGDIMLDHYVNGIVSRISPEAPVPVLLNKAENYYLGGAGNVFLNIHSLGGYSDIISVIGNDLNGDKVESLVSEKSDLSLLIKRSGIKTTTKSRYISNSHQLLRVDNEDIIDIDSNLESIILSKIESVIDFYDCVIMEDYNKGLLTSVLIKGIIKICKEKNKPVIVDPKLKNFDSYSGCTLIKPNFLEFCSLINKKLSPNDFDSIVYEGRNIISKLGIESILVTLSENGVILITANESYHSPSYPVKISDVSGAGDTVTAMISLCFSSGLDTKESLKLCNIAGSIACSSVGAVSVGIEDVYNSKYFNL